MSGTNPNFLADGDINPSRFVGPSLSNPNRVVQCDPFGDGGKSAAPIGVSQQGTKAAPIPSASTLAAAQGDPIKVYGDGEQCLLEYGGTVTQGDYLVPDTDGKAVTMQTSGEVQSYGAIALESGSSGDKRRVLVKIGKSPATAS